MPLLLIHGDPEASATPPGSTPDRHGASSAPHQVPKWKLASDTGRAPSPGVAPGGPGPGGVTTPTPTAPTEAGSTTPPPRPGPATADVVAQRAAVTAATTAPPTTTTTTTTATSVAVVVSGSLHYGQVTYYEHPAGTCASPWLAFGTVVQVTNPANGSSVSCVVNDREADTDRSIDLATSTFAEIAPLSQGVVDAQLRW
ncbi:MAG: septal ring lytic transglycosylase RlpA family protein [Acidimicrobiales bacterium]